MRCHKCNQDSLSIDNGHIVCDICGLDIDISINLEDDYLLDLFFYNRNLDEAEKLGHEAFLEDKRLGDNPYSLSSDQITQNKRWELGYNTEKESYELAALSFSAKKIEQELRAEIKELRAENEKLNKKVENFIPPNCKYIEDFCSNLRGKKIIGKLLNKEILVFINKYRAFHRDKLGTWKYPD